MAMKAINIKAVRRALASIPTEVRGYTIGHRYPYLLVRRRGRLFRWFLNQRQLIMDQHVGEPFEVRDVPELIAFVRKMTLSP